MTGDVIAVHDVSNIGEVDAYDHTGDGRDLSVKLVEVFHLVPKP